MNKTKISPSELLLHSFDETTLDKLELVVQQLEYSEQEDLDTFVSSVRTLCTRKEIRNKGTETRAEWRDFTE